MSHDSRFDFIRFMIRVCDSQIDVFVVRLLSLFGSIFRFMIHAFDSLEFFSYYFIKNIKHLGE